MSLSYSDIDPNVIELITRKLQTPLENLIEAKIQRRQQWGPTFKQEDIADLTMTDADYVVQAPDYGKRVIRMAGTLTAVRTLRLPPIPSAWWIIHNRTGQALHCLTDPTGVTGPTIPADAVGAVYTDGVGVWQFACCGSTGVGGGEVPPGGSPTNIQYKLNTTDFGGVDSSFVTGANVIWGGSQTVNKAGDRSQEFVINPTGAQLMILAQQFADPPANGAIVNFERGYGTFLAQGAITTTDSLIGRINFRGMAPTMTQLGYLKTVYTTTLGTGSITTLGSGTDGAARIEIGQGATTSYVQLFAGSSTFQIQPGGIVLTGGAPGAIFYQGPVVGTVSYLTALDTAGHEGHILKVVGGFPAWGVAAGASVPSLDQVTDPAAAKTFFMLNNQLTFRYTATDVNEDNFVVESVDGATGTGAVMLVRTGTGSTKAPFRAGVGTATNFAINNAGNIRINSASDTSTDTLKVQGISRFVCDNTSPAGVAVRIEQTSNVTNGETALYIDSTQTGTTSGLFLVSADVYVFSQVKIGSGAQADVRAINSEMAYTGTSTIPRLRSYTGFCNSINSIPTNGSYTVFFAADTVGTNAGMYRGLYIVKPTSTWGGYFGVIAEPGLLNGFGHASPLYTLHVSGTMRIDLGGDQKGDLYYRSDVNAPLTALHPTSNDWVLTLEAGVPVWKAVPGGPGTGAFPGSGALQTLQFKFSNTAFGTVGSSVVSGASNEHLTLGGNLTLDSTAGSTLKFNRPVDAGNGTEFGRISFYGQFAGTPNILYGAVRGYYSTDSSLNDGIIEMAGESGLAAFRVSSAVATMTTGSVYISVQSSGIKCSLGGLGAIYYKATVGTDHALAARETPGLGVGDGQVLSHNSTTGFPEWRTISATGGIAITGGSDLNAIQTRATGTTLNGVRVTPANGLFCASNGVDGVPTFRTSMPAGVRYSFPAAGTGAGLNVGSLAGGDPSGVGNGDIYYNASMGKFRGYAGGWVDLSGGGTGSMTIPGGGTELQYRNSGTALNALTGSSVTGAGTILNLGNYDDGITNIDSIRTTMRARSTIGLSPALDMHFFMTGSAPSDDSYAQRIHYYHKHTGTMSGGHKVLTLHWEQQVNSGVSTGGDIILELFASSVGGLGSGNSLEGLRVNMGASQGGSSWGTTIGVHVMPVTVSGSKYAILCNAGSGSVVFNGFGADLALSAPEGHLYIPTIAGTTAPTGGSLIGGCMALCYQWQTNKLWSFGGSPSQWRSVTFT